MKHPRTSREKTVSARTKKAVQEFFDEQSALFSEGKIEELASYCSHPLPFYTDDGIILATDAEMYQDILASYLSRIHAAGRVQFAGKVVGIGPKENGRFAVRLDWDHIEEDGSLRGTSKLRYFLADRPKGGYLIEIIEYFQFGGPPILNAPKPERLH
ncbi:MAG: hypothetical protein HKN63_00135 [Rhodobacteraceae bacterium]|nr:hypothetical protein [Paracoccaceae bacterium]